METAITQLDKLARYLINNYGDMVKVDDMSNEDAVDEAIRILENQRHLTSRSSRAADVCSFCDGVAFDELGHCQRCGKLIDPPPA